MNRRPFFAILLLLALPPAGASAQSQTDEHRLEVGALFTAVNLQGFGEAVKGVGGRVGYNLNDHLALEAEGSFFPRSHFGNDQFGQKAQGFVGVKAGARSKHVGLFAKLRPGVMSVGEITSGFDCDRTSFGEVCRPEHGNFALDAGGVVEFYPTSRSIVRVDLGDTIVRLRSTTRGFLSPPQTANDTTHNFQVSIGFGYRF